MLKYSTITPCSEGRYKVLQKYLRYFLGEWRNWYTRTTQNRVPYGVRVRFPPRPPTYYIFNKKMHNLIHSQFFIQLIGFIAVGCTFALFQ